LLAINLAAELPQKKDDAHFRNVPPFTEHEHADDSSIGIGCLLLPTQITGFLAITLVAVLRDK
jgi:hypothetical protein